jgi:predicted Zn-dependent protease
MARAGYDPRQAIRFWERMAEQGGGRQPAEFASDHPSHENRVAALEGWMPQAQAEHGRATRATP